MTLYSLWVIAASEGKCHKTSRLTTSLATSHLEDQCLKHPNVDCKVTCQFLSSQGLFIWRKSVTILATY